MNESTTINDPKKGDIPTAQNHELGEIKVAIIVDVKKFL
jgi:hypothetical protein